MLVLSERLVKAPIMSLQTGEQLAVTKEPIIDPRRLQIVAFYCEGSGLSKNQSVLHTADIREYSELGLIVNNNEDIMPLDDLVRLKEVLEFSFKLLDTKVIDTVQNKLGKVSNFAIDPRNFYIQKLYIRPPLLQSLNEAELVIDRTQIVEVNSEVIVVKAPTVEEKKKVTIPVPTEFTNPFRKPKAHPQPEH